jgi:RES domain-containing protein
MPVLSGSRVYRVCRARYARLDGAGALLVGGRWNSSGRAVVYMAESIALAVLENLVHNGQTRLPARLRLCGRCAPRWN